MSKLSDILSQDKHTLEKIQNDINEIKSMLMNFREELVTDEENFDGFVESYKDLCNKHNETLNQLEIELSAESTLKLNALLSQYKSNLELLPFDLRRIILQQMKRVIN